MQTVGGLKVIVEPGMRHDRRPRFARVTLSDVRTGEGSGQGKEIPLVTDSGGRMRYRLPDGEYRLRLPDGQETGFSVRNQRWTTVRLRFA